MGTLIGIFNAFRKLKKIKANLGRVKKLSGKNIFKIIMSFFYPVIAEILFLLLILLMVYYSMTQGVSDMFTKLQKMFGSSSSFTVEFLDSLDENTIQDLIDDNFSALNPKKIKKYMQKEKDSVPYGISGNKIIEVYKDNKMTSSTSERVNIDTSIYANRYKLNWEFIASVDIAKYKADETDNNVAINTANTLYPNFLWKEGYSQDTSNYKKNWYVTTEHDSSTNKTTVKETTKDKPTESKVVTKIPKAVPSTVNTAFGKYTYSVREDVTTLDTKYSKEYVLKEEVSSKEVFDKMVPDYSKPIYDTKEVYIVKSYGKNEGDSGYKEYKAPIDINTTFKTNKVYEYIGTDGDYYVYENGWWIFSSKLLIQKKDIPYDEVDQELIFDRVGTETIFTGKYMEKKKYKTITTKKVYYEQVRQVIVEDIVQEPSFKLEPTKFLNYINENELTVEDLELIKEILQSLPSSSAFVTEIDRIINSTYGQVGGGIGGGSNSGDVTLVGGFNSPIPLFLQWDKRWKDYSYAGETVGVAGCAVTSTSMTLTGLMADISKLKEYDLNNNNILEPDEVAYYSTKNNHAAYLQGTYQSIYKDIGEKAGLKVTQAFNFEEAYTALKQGKVVIVSVGPGNFTNGSHIMVMTGVTSSGDITINDPYSIENSNKAWNPAIVKRQSNAYFIFDNPNYITENFVATSYFAFTFSDAESIGTAEAFAQAQMQGGNDSTASGLYVLDKDLRHKIIAADNNKFKFKSKTFISFPEDVKKMTMPDGFVVDLDGWYTVEDTGGDIKNNRIDVYMGAWRTSPQYEDLAYKFGRRNVVIKRLNN